MPSLFAKKRAAAAARAKADAEEAGPPPAAVAPAPADGFEAAAAALEQTLATTLASAAASTERFKGSPDEPPPGFPNLPRHHDEPSAPTAAAGLSRAGGFLAPTALAAPGCAASGFLIPTDAPPPVHRLVFAQVGDHSPCIKYGLTPKMMALITSVCV